MAATLSPASAATPAATAQLASAIQSADIRTAIAAHPKKVIAIGDSLVYGYGDSEGGGWVDRLRLSYMNPEQPGPIFYNLGVRGDGVRQVAKRLESEFCDRGELRHRTPDILILSVGINDSARAGRPTGRSVTAIDVFEREMDQLLAQASSLCPVYFVGMVPVNEAAMPFAKILYFTHAEQIHYRDVTKRLCAAHSVPYLDLYEQWAQHDEHWISDRLCIDGIHPNPLGYRTILEAVQSWEPFTSAVI